MRWGLSKQWILLYIQIKLQSNIIQWKLTVCVWNESKEFIEDLYTFPRKCSNKFKE